MQPYVVTCTARGCQAPATHKVAARWSDGSTNELKTYALTCTACLSRELRSAKVRRANCRLAPGEILDEPQAIELNRR